MVEVLEWGSGPPAVLVHGDVFGAEATWSQQRPLGSRYLLRLINRRGFGQSPDVRGEDFDVDAGDVCQELGDGAHLVGHSYGAVVALLAASRCPSAVQSLTVVEPPAFGVVADRPEVSAFIAALEALIADGLSPREFLPRFIALVGGDLARLPSPLPPALVKAASVQMHGRFPWEAEIPLGELEALDCPKLVISGAHSPLFDAVCDEIETGIGAERAVIAGAGHSAPQVGDAFNRALVRCWEAA